MEFTLIASVSPIKLIDKGFKVRLYDDRGMWDRVLIEISTVEEWVALEKFCECRLQITPDCAIIPLGTLIG